LLAGTGTALAAGIYRWTDDAGRTHYGDQPPPDAERVGRTDGGATAGLRAVESVPDGDTVRLADGTEVRLIGINAPEVAHRDDPAEPGGPEAQRFLRGLLDGRRIRLEVGPEPKDDYGRTLAHVFTADGTNVAAELLRRGHAHVAIHPPNTTRLKEYLALERRARAAGRSIWGRPRYQLRPVAQAGDFRNTFRRLRGEVARVRTARKYIYLTFTEGLVARLEKDRRAAFAARGRSPGRLVGRRVVVRGWIQQRDGQPHLTLRHPAQIESLR
jgi:micrococcal nuclease